MADLDPWVLAPEQTSDLAFVHMWQNESAVRDGAVKSLLRPLIVPFEAACVTPLDRLPRRCHCGLVRLLPAGMVVTANLAPRLEDPPLGAPAPPPFSLGDLIDRLSIENVRLWHLQDQMGSPDDAVAAAAARLVNEANTRRVAYRAEITRRLEGGTPDGTRVYGSNNPNVRVAHAVRRE